MSKYQMSKYQTGLAARRRIISERILTERNEAQLREGAGKSHLHGATCCGNDCDKSGWRNMRHEDQTWGLQ